MTFRLWQALTLAIGLIAAIPAIGAACSCDIAGPPCEAAWKSDAVFSATVRWRSKSITMPTDARTARSWSPWT